MKLVLGTRGSPLARAQTELVRAAFARAHPSLEVSVRVVKTQGDKDRSSPIADLGTGAFTKELEEALLANEVDLAVHSLKDLPTELPGGLAVAAVLPRADFRDALCSRGRKKLLELDPGARVGTSSPRRSSMLLALRKDLDLRELRGNVESRLKRLELPRTDARALDAVVLARAGLERLGLASAISETLDGARFLPAPGQGAIALEARSADGKTLELARSIDDEKTRDETAAERLLHKLLGGGCRAPLGALAEKRGGAIVLRAAVSALDGSRILEAEGRGEDPARAAAAVFARLEPQGALDLLANARNDA